MEVTCITGAILNNIKSNFSKGKEYKCHFLNLFVVPVRYFYCNIKGFLKVVAKTCYQLKEKKLSKTYAVVDVLRNNFYRFFGIIHCI